MDAHALFDDDERGALREAVVAAESRTTGEIVPVVATASARYRAAEQRLAALAALAVLALAWIFLQDVFFEPADWGPRPRLALEFGWIAAILLAAYVAARFAAARWPGLALPLATRAEIAEAVDSAAWVAFARCRVRRTRAQTGVLIYVTLDERQVRVLGDDAIARRLAQADWDGLRDRIVAHLKEGRPAEALRTAIEGAGDLLAAHFPAEGGEDELHNDLRILG